LQLQIIHLTFRTCIDNSLCYLKIQNAIALNREKNLSFEEEYQHFIWLKCWWFTWPFRCHSEIDLISPLISTQYKYIYMNVCRHTLMFDEHQRISKNINRGVNESAAGLSSRLIDDGRPCIHMLIGCLIWFTGPQCMSVIYTVKSWLGSGNETADCWVTPVVWIRPGWTYSFYLPPTAEHHVGTVALPLLPTQCTALAPHSAWRSSKFITRF